MAKLSNGVYRAPSGGGGFSGDCHGKVCALRGFSSTVPFDSGSERCGAFPPRFLVSPTSSYGGGEHNVQFSVSQCWLAPSISCRQQQQQQWIARLETSPTLVSANHASAFPRGFPRPRWCTMTRDPVRAQPDLFGTKLAPSVPQVAVSAAPTCFCRLTALNIFPFSLKRSCRPRTKQKSAPCTRHLSAATRSCRR